MSDLEQQNAVFWNELCGSGVARSLGITDASPASLRRFDDWFFDFYPYLLTEVAVEKFAGRDVLEIGLGYGSLSQKIAERGARYVGLDIAEGPVRMVLHRLRQSGLPGVAEQGSVLAAPYSDASFDWIVSIGCLHHTGNMRGAIEECWRLLRPGGSLTIMVYYAYSYRRWIQARRQTLAYLKSELCGYRGVLQATAVNEKWDYDHDSKGMAAPHIDFISVKSLRRHFSKFARFSYRIRNIDQERPFQKRTREQLLTTIWPRVCGLDIYATAVK